jgi:hypothetical protein
MSDLRHRRGERHLSQRGQSRGKRDTIPLASSSRSSRWDFIAAPASRRAAMQSAALSRRPSDSGIVEINVKAAFR